MHPPIKLNEATHRLRRERESKQESGKEGVISSARLSAFPITESTLPLSTCLCLPVSLISLKSFIHHARISALFERKRRPQLLLSSHTLNLCVLPNPTCSNSEAAQFSALTCEFIKPTLTEPAIILHLQHVLFCSRQA